MSSPASSSDEVAQPVPGSYGLPFVGAIKDRLDYFYNQGKDAFFSTRVQKYNSTVIKTNMPPGPFISHDSRVVALLDAASFPILFDTSKVEKRNVFTGTYFPSVNFTGGYRILSQLDPSEPKHKALKSFLFSTFASKHNDFIPLFRACFSQCFTNVDKEMSAKNEASFNTFSDPMSFSFFFRLFCNIDPLDTKLGNGGAGLADKWIAPQLAPIGTLGLPKFLKYFEDLFLHTFPLPAFLVKSFYKKLYDAFYAHSGPILDKAKEDFGIEKEEACHNIVFFASFNGYGGMKIFLPTLIKWVGEAGEKLQGQLKNEIRSVVKEENGISFQALEKMELTKSTVYEALRINPPVEFQYGKAKEDMVIHSHDAAFSIKKGDMLFGYQPFATNDARVFDNPEEFVADRFVGEGEKLLKYVYWSNGRETENPTVENKQCPGKNLVVLLCRVFLVDLFLRYDAFTTEVGTSALGLSVKFTSLTKAKNAL